MLTAYLNYQLVSFDFMSHSPIARYYAIKVKSTFFAFSSKGLNFKT
jgi:hypothetical protein